jgi:hypothetical protein
MMKERKVAKCVRCAEPPEFSNPADLCRKCWLDWWNFKFDLKFGKVIEPSEQKKDFECKNK